MRGRALGGVLKTTIDGVIGSFVLATASRTASISEILHHDGAVGASTLT